jgi:hypothetical protein
VDGARLSAERVTGNRVVRVRIVAEARAQAPAGAGAADQADGAPGR